jgi:DNA-directed RNA polymerase sigma subunit (sigma70/sigma32)
MASSLRRARRLSKKRVNNMKLKIVDLSEKQLKDYLVASFQMKEMTEDKLELVLNKYKKTEGSQDDDIQRLLIESHLKMVIAIANRYRAAGISFAGLIRHGNAGLISAVKKWDCGENEEFLPYLVWNIEGAILDALIRVKKDENPSSQKNRFGGQG